MAERKSRYHGLTSDGHGPDEHGLGGLASPEDPRDFAIADHPGYAAALATVFPSAWLEPNTLLISNQGATPQCVAYSSANDQGHMDRPESGLVTPPTTGRSSSPRSAAARTAPMSGARSPAGSTSATRSRPRRTRRRRTSHYPKRLPWRARQVLGAR